MNATPKDSSTGSNQNLDRVHNDMLIRDLPGLVRKDLCDHLDSLDVWQQLAAYVKLYPQDVEQIQNQKMRNCSPTSKFLDIWGGQYSHTVYSLFALLKKYVETAFADFESYVYFIRFLL